MTELKYELCLEFPCGFKYSVKYSPVPKNISDLNHQLDDIVCPLHGKECRLSGIVPTKRYNRLPELGEAQIFYELYKKGLSFRKIGEKYFRSHNTVKTRIKQWEKHLKKQTKKRKGVGRNGNK